MPTMLARRKSGPVGGNPQPRWWLAARSMNSRRRSPREPGWRTYSPLRRSSFSRGRLFDRNLGHAYIGSKPSFRICVDMEGTTADIGTRRIVLTDNATRRIAALKVQEKAENAFLRIAVSGGGCSGFQYGLSFDDQRNEDDFVFERDGVAVIVDDVSLDLLTGAEVDFVEDLMGASFQIRNPNAASSCGCGNSFSVA